MDELVSAIESSIRENPHSSVEAAVFGTDDSRFMVTCIEQLCAETLSTAIKRCLFYKATVGVVVGLELSDGTRCVLKAYQPRWSQGLLKGVHRVQGHLAAGGFPCPVPLSGPHPLALGFATVDHAVPDPGQGPLTHEMMGVSARGLAELISRCQGQDGAGLTDHPFQAAPGELYTEPHSPVFDFRSTTGGAEWIDELALAANEVRNADPSAPVIAHTDWSVRNVRLGQSKVLVAYDWDSLALVPESQAVGQAAVAWAAFDEVSDPVAPSAQAVVEYIRHYETGRGSPFTSTQRRAAGGAALWMLAYTARCEHAIGSLRPWALPRLHTDARRLLELHEQF